MKLLEISRRYVFWLLDILKGGKTRKHYREISFILCFSDPDGIARWREEVLLSLLDHAVKTTEFYKKINNYKGLNSFPVINKTIIRESFNSFISNQFKESELTPVVTSGSTGTPFKVLKNKSKILRNSADTIFFAQKAGYRLGERIIYMKIWVKEKMKSNFSYWMENIIPIDVIKFDDAQIEKFLHRLKIEKSACTLIGYSSALELLCKYLDKKDIGKLKLNVRTIIAISETLHDHTKTRLQKYFHVPVVSRYSNLENGIIAQQDISGSDKYLINSASYIVEILDINSDKQVESGQSGRIVITDLFNYGMPLVRYDTGDIGEISQDPKNPETIFLSKVEGRKLDFLYDTDGNLVSPYLVYKHMWQYTDINQYQVIQESRKEYSVRINIDRVFNKEEKLINELKTYLGKDAVISVQYVSEIPLLSSGKRKMIVNNYLQI